MSDVRPDRAPRPVCRPHSLTRIALAGLLLTLVATSPARAAAVFINEIHYDNTGTDVGEAIEIAGPAGTDLTGWSLVLYNGANSLSYDTTALSGILPAQQGGFGTLFFSYPTNGIQNGSPDGVALVDAGSSVVEFLSYEGSFVAADGPAAGMSSTDIGVAESSGTPIGESLQRVGTGSDSADFTWSGPAPDSFGFPNSGQTFASGPVDPVINEFVANHTGADTEAFVEVFGSASADYSAFTVLEIEGDGSGAGTIDAVLPVGVTNAGGYWIDDEDMENGTLTILLVENFSGSLFDDLDTDNDGVLDSTPWDRVVDDVAASDGGGSDRTYSATVLGPFFDGNPFGAGGASRIPNGADTDTAADWVRNDFDGAGFPGFPGTPAPGEALNTPDAVNELVPVPLPEIVINEILQNPAAVSDGDGEWFELYNAGGGAVDIDGWTVRDNDFDSHVIANGGPLVIPAGGFLVLGTEANPALNGGVAVDYEYSGIFLANGADELVLLDGSSNEIDRVEWDGGPGFPDPNGASMALRDPTLDNNV
ncbi:MAG: lamin tail domain-containing protein, partial [Thermoanaerobaculia bacterium]|nr:lamin tail domain-containing protein [Thermoanaerobaculia bacterium]